MESERQLVGPINPHMLHTVVDDEISIYDPRTERMTVLNTTASDIWRLADGSLTMNEMTDLLASSYEVDPDSIADDVKETVARLRQAGVIEDQ